MLLFLLLRSSLISAQTDAEMKAWQTYMTPGQVHKMLESQNGEWTEEMTMWMEPGKPPTKATATSVNEMLLGGRYQQSKITGTMMGQPFEGLSIVGYDNARKVFTSTWIDNMGTGTMTLEGVWNSAKKTIVSKGKAVDPSTGKIIAVRQVIKIIDDDHQEMQMYDTKNGKERKTMELKMSRKK